MSTSYRRKFGYAFAVLTLSAMEGREAKAQLRLDLVAERRLDLYAHVTSPRLNAGRPARLVVRNRSLSASLSRVAVGDRFSIVSAADAVGLPHLTWTPPKRLLLDEAARWIELDAFREQLVDNARNEALDSTQADAQSRGLGVAVGIVDGGIDFTHPDLQHEDGSTRVAWFLDYASPALGRHATLEAEYGCTLVDSPCAILSADDINEALSAGSDAEIQLPDDRMGHGTHVASLAAGSGRASGQYQGVAPEATLIVARISDNNADVQDADVLLATQFVFDRADELELPAVVNLSLGGDFGPHDGSTLLEEALTEFLDVPGRSIVVAAGNSASMIEQGSEASPGPLGIHTDVYVDGTEQVSLLIPDESSEYNADVFIWVDSEPNQPLEVGVRSDSDVVVGPVAPGRLADGTTENWEALVSNQAALEQAELVDYEQGALVLLTGTFIAGETIEILLRGTGTASLWVQSSGDLGLETGSPGALFSAARRGGTITVPATAPGLIAVGATLNRVNWPSRSLRDATLFPFTEQLDSTPGSVAFFSSLGPNQLGQIKPDILAPGALVIGAMAPSSDPAPTSGQINFESMFLATPMCGEDLMCAVVNDEYGIALGTSMAAPIVTGAVALMLAQDPELTQPQLLSLLQAGVTRIHKSTTTPEDEAALPPVPGMLDLSRTQAAFELSQEAQSAPAVPSPETSWLTLADVYVTPSGLMRGLLRTRSSNDQLADVDLDSLDLDVEYGLVDQPLSQRAPGLFSFSVRARAGSSGTASTGVGEHPLTVRALFEGEELARAEVPIALDLNALRGLRRPPPRLKQESGCSVVSSPTRTMGSAPQWGLTLLLGAAWLLRLGRSGRRPF